MIKLLYGSFYSYERVRFTGLNTQNILNTATANGIVLKKVVRIDYAVMEADVLRHQVKKLKKLLGENRYKSETVKRRGLSYKVTANKSRLCLWIMLFVSVIGLYLVFSRVWSVKVIGYENTEKIENVIKEKGMLTWRLKAYDLIEEAEEALFECDGDILWNSVEINGSVVEVYIRKDTSTKIQEDEKGNIVAKKDCILKNLIVTSGTAKAQNGQAVSKGQVLIEATQKFGDTVFDVSAQGKAIASVWYYGSEEISAEEVKYKETGAFVDYYEISFFGKMVFSKSKREFENYKEIRQRVNTFFLPIKIEKIRLLETKAETQSIDKEQAIKETEKEIINRLKLQIPEDAQVYETKTSVSEKDGVIKISVYIETVENVAVRG